MSPGGILTSCASKMITLKENFVIINRWFILTTVLILLSGVFMNAHAKETELAYFALG